MFAFNMLTRKKVCEKKKTIIHKIRFIYIGNS